MDIDRERRALLTAAGGAALAGTAAAQDGNATSNATDGDDEDAASEGGDREPQTHTVEMRTEGSTYLFDPVGLHVQPGDTVEWVNVSGAHSSTAYEDRIPEDADPWDSGVMTEEGATFRYTFEAEGTYDYFCTPHKTLGMVARIVCGEPGGPASGSTPPDDVGGGQFPTEQAIVDEGSLAYPWTPDEGGDGGDGGEEAGGGEESLHEIGVPLQAHFVGLGAILGVFVSLVFAFYFLKYGESPEHSDQRDR
jgi:plastocyanin